MPQDRAVLEMRAIEKSFAHNRVLDKVDFSLNRGEVHALMGGNGAGKSTLMKILSGVYEKDGGTIRIEGEAVAFADATDARRAGIAMIFQEFSLVPTLSVAQNIFLNGEPKTGIFIRDGEAVRRARRILDELGVDIDPRVSVGELSVGQCQMVEIAKALSRQARILVMDEPTASLSEAETEALFALVGRLKASGISIIYISHRMAEIFSVCDRVTVMRDGGVRLTAPCSEVSMAELVETMLGSDEVEGFTWHDRGYRRSGAPLLTLRGVSLPSRISDVSFEVGAGEIVGIAGLMGSGRTEIAEAIFGRRTLSAGEILIDGRPVTSQAQAIAAGIALVPEDRRRLGLVLEHSVGQNMLLPSLGLFTAGAFVNDRGAARMIRRMIEALNIKTESADKPARLLSGGNQQKIVLGKWLARRPRLLVLDEPTIGVDIGAKSEIARVVREMADEGVAVIIISSELEELLAVSDRLLVLHNGRIFQDVQRQDIGSEEELHHAIQGHRLGAAPAGAAA
ncbi:sugar ABC transporter ATP-binding protein [Shinella sp.]|uniref:sugar ABC transporter ATP-binding protein n=1 Tax=Shinella sp. TaxID=1870904 RepID=UPI00301D37FD